MFTVVFSRSPPTGQWLIGRQRFTKTMEKYTLAHPFVKVKNDTPRPFLLDKEGSANYIQQRSSKTI
jgi:hypothetical protein